MGLSIANAGQAVSAFRFPPEDGRMRLLQDCLEDLERGEINAAHKHLKSVTALEPSNEEAPLVCWTAAQLGLAQMNVRDLGAAMPWFEYAIEVAETSGLMHCVSLLQMLFHLGKAWVAAEEARSNAAQTLTQLGQEIQTLEGELHAGVESLLQVLSSSQFNVESGFSPSPSLPRPRPSSRETLFVRMLGDFAVTREGGQPVTLCSNRKGQMIFKLMLTYPTNAFHKEALLEMFWPDEDPDIAVGKLHIAISRLRRALEQAGLGKHAIVFEIDAYHLHEDLQVQSDIITFDAHYQAGYRHLSNGTPEAAAREFEQALVIYSGPYLTEILGEDWLLSERLRLEEQYLKMLTDLASWRYECGDFVEGAKLCRRVLAVDDLREDIYRLLMRCLAQSGQRTKALRLYNDLECTLEKELGVRPMKTTQELADRIKVEAAP